MLRTQQMMSPRRSKRLKERWHQPELCLPKNMIMEILSRVPVKLLLRFRCVCKAWLSLISDYYFIQLHLERSHQDANKKLHIMTKFHDCFYSYSLEIEESSSSCDRIEQTTSHHEYLSKTSGIQCSKTTLWGSCNGLVCIQTDEREFGLLNPSTRSYRKLPYSEVVVPHAIKDEYPYCFNAYGFGYDAKIKDYKLVRISSFFGGRIYNSEVKVFTLGTNEWRRLPDTAYRVSDAAYRDNTESGKLVNGGLHWINKEHQLIICFDIEDEVFKEVPQSVYNSNSTFGVELGELGGNLTLACNMYDEIEVWVMKEYGVKESWTKILSINRLILPLIRLCSDPLPLGILKNNGGILFAAESPHLFLCKSEGNQVRRFKFYGVTIQSTLHSVTYVESLVLPNMNNSRAKRISRTSQGK